MKDKDIIQRDKIVLFIMVIFFVMNFIFSMSDSVIQSKKINKIECAIGLVGCESSSIINQITHDGYQEECYEYKTEEKYKLVSPEDTIQCYKRCGCYKYDGDDLNMIGKWKCLGESLYCASLCPIETEPRIEYYNETTCIKNHLVKVNEQ